MALSVLHSVSTLELKLSGWYWCHVLWYGKSHIIFSIYYFQNIWNIQYIFQD